MVRFGLDSRGGESLRLSRSGGSGVRVSARPDIFASSNIPRIPDGFTVRPETRGLLPRSCAYPCTVRPETGATAYTL